MTPIEEFAREREHAIHALAANDELRNHGLEFLNASAKYKYSYLFDWLGLPIIQYPQDIVSMQEIIWNEKPDLIIETGVARGGSLIFYASLLQLIGGGGIVVGIDIDIRHHNREKIESHPLSHRVRLIQGSSVGDDVIESVERYVKDACRVLVILDSLHTHDHVARELELYTRYVSIGSYCVVFDTVIEHMETTAFANRPWSKGDNPYTAVRKFLETNPHFEIDHTIEDKLLITSAPGGYLRRVS